MKVSQRNWAEVFGEGNMFAISPVSTFQKVNIILFNLLLRNVWKKGFLYCKNNSLHRRVKTVYEK